MGGWPRMAIGTKTVESSSRALFFEAMRVAALLKSRDLRIVFAESCTGGLVSASLAQIPGISSQLCGSAVTYRDATKSEWLGVAPAKLKGKGAVSAGVARLMALGALKKTR